MRNFECVTVFCPYCRKVHKVEKFFYREKDNFRCVKPVKTGYYCTYSDKYFNHVRK